ncbi:MAG: hypothetical protein JWO99_806 [Candidatus Saccharibacteria bacterium]|nr:hypothetical protein [Candidatus Saccharibacteria bacterium]
MRSFVLVSRQKVGYVITAAAILLGAFVPALANAADVTERSIALSSSSADASSVNYTVSFKATGAAGAFVLDFCSNSPILNASCTAPGGFDVGTPTTTTSGYTVAKTTAGPANQVVVASTGGISAGDTVTVELTGLHNPTAVGTFYARIVTYDTNTNALLYTSTGSKTGSVDNGGVALSTASTVGVSGAVLESMTFCVSGTAITGAGCSAGVTAPTLRLGEDPGTGVLSLVDGTTSTGTIYTQLSTNATGGAVINLKSSATNCGGLINSSKPSGCYILPVQQLGIIDHTAGFGVKLGTATGTGAYTAASGSGYNASTYTLNAATDNTTGVTSAYGDPFLNTGGNTATNLNQPLIFGATVGPSTPAGNYSADIGLIATGKF